MDRVDLSLFLSISVSPRFMHSTSLYSNWMMVSVREIIRGVLITNKIFLNWKHCIKYVLFSYRNFCLFAVVVYSQNQLFVTTDTDLLTEFHCVSKIPNENINLLVDYCTKRNKNKTKTILNCPIVHCVCVQWTPAQNNLWWWYSGSHFENWRNHQIK